MGAKVLRRTRLSTGEGQICIDGTCAMQIIKQRRGSFKRVKHIKVCFFWLKELIDHGQIELICIHMDELVADILTKLDGYSVTCCKNCLAGVTATWKNTLFKLLRRCVGICMQLWEVQGYTISMQGS
jgi:hypothetical protein